MIIRKYFVITNGYSYLKERQYEFIEVQNIEEATKFYEDDKINDICEVFDEYYSQLVVKLN